MLPAKLQTKLWFDRPCSAQGPRLPAILHSTRHGGDLTFYPAWYPRASVPRPSSREPVRLADGIARMKHEVLARNKSPLRHPYSLGMTVKWARSSSASYTPDSWSSERRQKALLWFHLAIRRLYLISLHYLPNIITQPSYPHPTTYTTLPHPFPSFNQSLPRLLNLLPTPPPPLPTGAKFSLPSAIVFLSPNPLFFPSPPRSLTTAESV